MLDDIQAFFRHVLKHRFIYIAALAHVIFLGPLYYLGPYQITREHQEQTRQQTQVYARAAHQAEIKKRVEDMAQIEKLMERITASQNASLSTNGKEASSTANTPATDTPKASLVELLENAKRISQNIDQLSQAQRAEQLAQLTGMPLEHARKEIRDEQAPPSSQEENTNPLLGTRPISELDLANIPAEQIDAAISQYHNQSRDALAQIIEQERQTTQGMDVSSLGESDFEFEASDGNNNSALITEAEQALATSARKFNQGPTNGTFAGKFSASYDTTSAPTTSPPATLGTMTAPGYGRIVGPNGPKADRLYLDTWYTLGPFSYSGKDHWDKPYPPERLVDLDAVYQGKNGKPLTWEFHQSGSYPLIPPHADGDAVFFGYTELSFQQETTVWAALGCDDECKLWVNDEFTWRSGEQSKPWYARGGYQRLNLSIQQWELTESYQKITFRAGKNTILFRLDNGYRDMFFSMVLAPIQSRE